MGDSFHEGVKCPHGDCDGFMGFGPVENCTCFMNPPCGACEENPLVCLECGWAEEDGIDA